MHLKTNKNPLRSFCRQKENDLEENKEINKGRDSTNNGKQVNIGNINRYALVILIDI